MKETSKNPKVILLLPDIRSAHNVGAIFRTADAAGVSKIYLIGYTPCPIDRFGRPQPEISKTALGAEQNIPWEYKKSAAIVLNKLKTQGVTLIALEQAENSVDYKKIKIKNDQEVCIILGNEVSGLSKSILNKVDIIAEIPMKGEKESLNVSVAGGILLYKILGL